MAKILRLILLSCFPLLGFSQVNELPVHFGQFYNNPQINPAEGGSIGNFEFSIGTKQNAGVFSGVKTSYASFNSKILKKERNFHVLGIHFNNDKEGLVLRRNRTYLSYSRHLSITENWMLAAGISGGLYNFAIKSNPVTGGANDATMDFNGGLHLYSESRYLSLSINQLGGGEVAPLEQVIRLIPIYQIRYSQIINLQKDIQIRTIAFAKYAEINQIEDDFRTGLGLKFSLKKLVNFGTSYETNEGVHFFLGLSDFTKKLVDRDSNKTNKLNFELGYFSPSLNNNRTNINAFELTCHYFIF